VGEVFPIDRGLLMGDPLLMDFPASAQHEVHLPPLDKTFCPCAGAQDFQDQMLPEMTQIVIADVAPPANEGDRPRVGPVGPGAAQHLASAAVMERRQGKNGARHISRLLDTP
jgi:hypothetical protein